MSPFDVSRDVLPPGHDVAVLLGVLEYLSDVGVALDSLSRCVPHLLASYVVRQGAGYSTEQQKALGWRNHYSADEIKDVLEHSGWRVTSVSEDDQGKTHLLLCRSKRL